MLHGVTLKHHNWSVFQAVDAGMLEETDVCDFNRFFSAGHTHRACARGVGNQEGIGMPWGSGAGP